VASRPLDREPSRAVDELRSVVHATRRRPLDPSRRRTLLRAHGRNAKDASYRLLQINQTNRHSANRSILSLSREEDEVDAPSHASASPFPPRSPLIDDQSGIRAAPPFASSLITLNSIQRVSRPDSAPASLLTETRSPSAETAFAKQLVRLRSRSAAMPLTPSSRVRPSPGVHAEDRAPPKSRQRLRSLRSRVPSLHRVRRFLRPLSRPGSSAPATSSSPPSRG